MQKIFSFNKYMNEGKVDYNEFKELCEAYLSYISDMGFIVRVIQLKSESAICIRNNNENSDYSWNDIKDDLIPFLTILNNQYKISDIKFGYTRSDLASYEINDIITDSIDIDYISSRIRPGSKLYYIEIPLENNFFKS